MEHGNYNIEIGNGGYVHDSAVIRIGATQTKTFISGINRVTVADGVGVVIGASGQLGTLTSSARYKEAIQPMAKASEAILSLQPVTFHYKKELDPAGIPQFGLVAEQVAKVNPIWWRGTKKASPTLSVMKRSTRCCSTSSSRNIAR